jgi:hypothetical protein
LGGESSMLLPSSIQGDRGGREHGIVRALMPTRSAHPEFAGRAPAWQHAPAP